MEEILKGLYATYQEIKDMSEEEIMNEYGGNKSEIINDIEKEIDEYEKGSDVCYMVYDLDPAFSSFESVNSMFV